MKIGNLDRAKKVVEEIERFQNRILYLQTKKLEEKKFDLRIKGKVPGGDRFEFYASMGDLESYVVAQLIQRYQGFLKELETELETL